MIVPGDVIESPGDVMLIFISFPGDIKLIPGEVMLAGLIILLTVLTHALLEGQVVLVLSMDRPAVDVISVSASPTQSSMVVLLASSNSFSWASVRALPK